MSKFIVCNKEEVKNELLSYGYPLLREVNGCFLFANIECKTLKFDKSKVMFTDNMTF